MSESVVSMLYRWPEAARFGRVIPKTKVYEHVAIGSALKEKFVRDVRRITWSYKLGESTINLAGSVEVPEIQVFEIEAKTDDVAESVLAAIDKAVRSPIIFEICRGQGDSESVRMIAAHKRLGTGAPKLGPYFSTEWQHPSDERFPLPTAIDLTRMYTALLQPLTPVAPRVGEAVSEVVDRLTAVRALEREVAALERKLRIEPQLNRKFELRRILRAKQADLAELTSTTNSPAAGNTN